MTLPAAKTCVVCQTGLLFFVVLIETTSHGNALDKQQFVVIIGGRKFDKRWFVIANPRVQVFDCPGDCFLA